MPGECPAGTGGVGKMGGNAWKNGRKNEK